MNNETQVLKLMWKIENDNDYCLSEKTKDLLALIQTDEVI